MKLAMIISSHRFSSALFTTRLFFPSLVSRVKLASAINRTSSRTSSSSSSSSIMGAPETGSDPHTHTIATKEPVQVRRTRNAITLYIVAVIAMLGVPLWYFTTSITRSQLPVEDINRLSSQLQNEISFTIPVYVDLPNSQDVFVDTCQQLLTHTLEERYPGLTRLWNLSLRRIQHRNISASDEYVVRILTAGGDESDQLELYHVSPFSKETVLTVTQNAIGQNKVAEFVVDTLVEKVFQSEIDLFYRILTSGKSPNEDNQVVLSYAPKYNLVLSLFSQDGNPLSWDIETLIQTLDPLLQRLRPFANFSVSTQIQYYADPSNPMRYDPDSDVYVISENELSTFINHGDWNLFSHDIHPTINFLVYFPHANYDNKKTVIEHSTTNSFLVNQWGGVYVFNKGMPIIKNVPVRITEDELVPILEIFSSQLFELLGVPHEPVSPSIRVDILNRIATYANLRQLIDNLRSLIKVSESLADILIPEETQLHAIAAIASIESALQALGNVTGSTQFGGITSISANAVTYSNKAFFDKEMVQQAYFPSEHKLAVFLPLLGPVGSIVVLGLLATLKQMKKDRDEDKRNRADTKAKKSE